MNKKKKSTNTSPYPDEVIDRLARAFYPAILACWNSEEGQREFAAWQAEQSHHIPSKEKQSVPDWTHLGEIYLYKAGRSLFWERPAVFMRQQARLVVLPALSAISRIHAGLPRC